MSEPFPQEALLSRPSLRRWQASYKARQAQVASTQAEHPPAGVVQPAATPPRVKRLAPHKRRALRQAKRRN